MKVSIIIRTKDEAPWISACIESIYSQSINASLEVIVVDNLSTDNTVGIIEEYSDVILLRYNDIYFKPGKALNLGISHSSGDIIVLLSAHCIPRGHNWLSCLINQLLVDPLCIGVYGRQIPLKFSPAIDKRDLSAYFSLESKKQYKDPFFHNANSAIRRKDWQDCNFSEVTPHIEDRLWASQMLTSNKYIFYSSESTVYHYHGVSHGTNSSRTEVISDLIWSNCHEYKDQDKVNHLLLKKSNCVAIVPIRNSLDNIPCFRGKYIFEYCLQQVRQSGFIKDIVAITDSEDTTTFIRALGCSVIQKSASELSQAMNKIYAQKLQEFYGRRGSHPDYFIILYPEYPFRPSSLFHDLYLYSIQTGSDLTFVAYEDDLLKKSGRFFNNSTSSFDDLIPCPGLGLVVKFQALINGLDHSTLKKSHLVLTDSHSKHYALTYDQIGSIVESWSQADPDDQ